MARNGCGAMPDVVGSHFQGKPGATNPWDAKGDGKGHCAEPHAVWMALCAPGPDQYLLEMPTGRSACAPRPPRVRYHGSRGAHWAGSPWKGAVGLQTPRPPAPAPRPPAPAPHAPRPAELHTAHSRLRPSSVAPTIPPSEGGALSPPCARVRN